MHLFAIESNTKMVSQQKELSTEACQSHGQAITGRYLLVERNMSSSFLRGICVS
jgi:hypothetical protein